MNFEAIHCFDRATVRFAIDTTSSQRLLGEITEAALRDVFGAKGGPDSLVRACELHFPTIRAKAFERQAAGSKAAVLLDTADFESRTTGPAPLSAS